MEAWKIIFLFNWVTILGSMLIFAGCTYIWVILSLLNVGKYTIRGSYGLKRPTDQNSNKHLLGNPFRDSLGA